MRSALAAGLLLITAGARGDTSIGNAGSSLSSCPPVEWPMSRKEDRAEAERFRALVGNRVHPVQVTDHHIVFGTFWEYGKGAGAVIDRASGRVVWRGGEALTIAEDERGQLDGILARERDGALAYFRANGERAWRLPPKLGGDAARALVDGTRVVVVLYEAISCGTALAAFDRAGGALAWQADVDQIMVGHSKYAHTAGIALRGSDVVLNDTQSGGCSLQTFDRTTGRRRSSLKKQDW